MFDSMDTFDAKKFEDQFFDNLKINLSGPHSNAITFQQYEQSIKEYLNKKNELDKLWNEQRKLIDQQWHLIGSALPTTIMSYSDTFLDDKRKLSNKIDELNATLKLQQTSIGVKDKVIENQSKLIDSLQREIDALKTESMPPLSEVKSTQTESMLPPSSESSELQEYEEMVEVPWRHPFIVN